MDKTVKIKLVSFKSEFSIAFDYLDASGNVKKFWETHSVDMSNLENVLSHIVAECQAIEDLNIIDKLEYGLDFNIDAEGCDYIYNLEAFTYYSDIGDITTHRYVIDGDEYIGMVHDIKEGKSDIDDIINDVKLEVRYKTKKVAFIDIEHCGYMFFDASTY